MKKLVSDGVELTLSSSFPRVDCGPPAFAETRFAVVEVPPFDIAGIFTLLGGDFRYLYRGTGSSVEADREVQALKNVPYDDWHGVTGGNYFNEVVRPRCYSKEPA